MPPIRRQQKPPSMLIACRVALMFFFFVVVVVIVWNPFYPVNRPTVNIISSSYHNTSWISSINPSNIFHAVESLVHSTPTIPGSEASDLDTNAILKRIILLRKRAATFLNWVANYGSENYIRWDMISKADLHILHKLIQALDHYLVTREGQEYLISLYLNGVQCSPLQAAQQEVISKFIAMDICSEIEWYKLVQLSWPEARVFFDVGANKGYLGSLFLTLWGGSAFHAAPFDVFSITKRLNSWKNARNPSGYCKDGENHAIQSYCPENYQRNAKNGKCDMINKQIRVYSFDGSSYLTTTLNSIIKTELFKGKNQVSPWNYENYAISDEVGTAQFTKQDINFHAGFEGGGIKHIIPQNDNNKAGKVQTAPTTEEVPMTTIDHYLTTHNITSVDILKIDTEGNDNKVLRGAKNAILKLVGMFTFEGGKGVSLTYDMLMSLDKMQFTCYSTSRAGLFKWSAQCMKRQYTGGFRAKDKGNIFCISRSRAPLAAFAYELLSFPVMIKLLEDQQQNSRETDVKIMQMLEALNKTKTPGKNEEVTLQSKKIDPALLVPLYVNIYGYCAPWPSCVKVGNLTIPSSF